MGIFDRLRSTATTPVTTETPTPQTPPVQEAKTPVPLREYYSPEARTVLANAPVPTTLPVPEQKSPVVQMPNVIVDFSGAITQSESTLRAFWKFIHGKQPGLIEQFQHQRKS